MDVVEFIEQKAHSDDGEIGRELKEDAPVKPMPSWSSTIDVMQDVLAISPNLPNR